MGRTGRASYAACLTALLLTVGCKNSVDVSSTDQQPHWRIVRYLCDATGCGWMASDPDGTGRQLLFTPLVESPSASPDGLRVAYITTPSNRLVVRTLATQGELDLEWPTVPTSVSWSPDGRLLAVLDFNDDTRNGALNLVQPDGTGRRVLTLGVFYPALVSWSPDGARLLVTRFTGELEIVHAGTGAVERQLDANGEWGIWSPDGQQAIYTRNRDPTPSFRVVNRDGTNRRQLLLSDPPDPPRGLSSFVWPTISPDGRYIVALRTGQASGGIFRITLDGRRERWSNGEVFLEGGRHFWLPVK